MKGVGGYSTRGVILGEVEREWGRRGKQMPVTASGTKL
jgi:hypothetical protein